MKNSRLKQFLVVKLHFVLKIQNPFPNISDKFNDFKTPETFMYPVLEALGTWRFWSFHYNEVLVTNVKFVFWNGLIREMWTIMITLNPLFLGPKKISLSLSLLFFLQITSLPKLLPKSPRIYFSHINKRKFCQTNLVGHWVFNFI